MSTLVVKGQKDRSRLMLVLQSSVELELKLRQMTETEQCPLTSAFMIYPKEAVSSLFHELGKVMLRRDLDPQVFIVSHKTGQVIVIHFCIPDPEPELLLLVYAEAESLEFADDQVNQLIVAVSGQFPTEDFEIFTKDYAGIGAFYVVLVDDSRMILFDMESYQAALPAEIKIAAD